MPLPLLIPLAIGIGGAVGKMIGRGSANRKMDELLKQDPQYKINPVAQERYNLTKTLLNARMPGSAQVERNLFSKTANQAYGIDTNATDSSQALALKSQAYGNLGSELTDLGTMEAQDYQRRFGNYANAGEAMVNEGDKVYNDQLRRYSNKFDVEGAKQENRQNTWGDISNLGFSMLNFGAAGGFKGMFGGGGGGGMSPMSIPGISRGSVGGFNLGNNFNSPVPIMNRR